MTKKELLDYVMNTPNNTNRQVLQYLLDDMGGGGGEGNIPLPEYKSTIIDGSESGFTLDLHPDDVEEFSFIEVSMTGETIYIILDYDTNSGIIFNEYGIIYFIRDIGATLKGTNIVCYTEAWPPSQPTEESYTTWRYENNVNLGYDTYNYQDDGRTVNGFITTETHPISSFGDMELLSYVKVETISEDSGMFTDITGVVIDGDFMPIENFYNNWNNGNISKESSYKYVFIFKGEAEATYGMCRLTWYGAELRINK